MSLTETKKPSSAQAPFAKKAAALKAANAKQCQYVPAADGPVLRSHNQPAPPLSPRINDDQVLTFSQWCKLNALSERTGRRVLASGEGPVVTELSAARIGVTVGNNRAWQQARARG